MKRKYEFNWYNFLDKKGIENHLNKMAEKGWLLEKVGINFFRYTKTQKQNVRYAVTYFPKGACLQSPMIMKVKKQFGYTAEYCT